MTTRREFRAGVAALAEGLRARIDAAAEGLDAAGADARRARAARDMEFFARTYFPHMVSGGGSALHSYLYSRLSFMPGERGRRLALAAPRGEAKSTICAHIFVLWCVVHELVHYVPIIQVSHDQAVRTLEAIKDELESNARLCMDYPAACGPGRVWNAGVAVTARNVKLQALGSGTRFRGLRHGPWRPDLVVMDDIENDENVASPEQRDKLERWMNRAVLKLGPPDGSLTVLLIGTVLHYDSVLARTLRRPTWESRVFRAVIEWPHRMDLWDEWGEALHNGGEESAALFYKKHNRGGEMERGAKVSWPDKRPLYLLMTERYADRAAFDSEFQNDPVSADDSPFGEVPLWVAEDPDWVFYGAVDPSLGKTGRGRDPSAILVGGFNRKTGVLDVVEAKIARRLPDRIIEDVIALQAKHRCLAWAVEAVQYQEFLRTELVKRGAARGTPVPAVPVTPHRDKALRIEALQPHVQNGLIRAHPGQTVLLQQLRHWPKADHDDGPDALAMLWDLAQRGNAEAPRTSGVRRAAARGAYDDFVRM
jgi:predicted phage terminase large subunit-like protein